MRDAALKLTFISRRVHKPRAYAWEGKWFHAPKEKCCCSCFESKTWTKACGIHGRPTFFSSTKPVCVVAEVFTTEVFMAQSLQSGTLRGGERSDLKPHIPEIIAQVLVPLVSKTSSD